MGLAQRRKGAKSVLPRIMAFILYRKLVKEWVVELWRRLSVWAEWMFSACFAQTDGLRHELRNFFTSCQTESFAVGTEMANVPPPLGFSSNRTSPACCCKIRLAVGKPKPMPWTLVL